MRSRFHANRMPAIVGMFRKCSFLICIGVSSLGLGSQSHEWKMFTSPEYGYSVCYPASWYLFTTTLSPKLDSLDILSFPPTERVEGVVLIDKGAEIKVGRAPTRMQTIDQWVREDTKFDVDVSKHQINNFTKSASGCTYLEEVVSRSEIGPGRYEDNTSYYCTTPKGLYQVALTNWKGNPNEEQLRSIALKIALTLRVQ